MEVSDYFVSKMKKTRIKSLEVTFADSLSHTYLLLFDESIFFILLLSCQYHELGIVPLVHSYWITVTLIK